MRRTSTRAHTDVGKWSSLLEGPHPKGSWLYPSYRGPTVKTASRNQTAHSREETSGSPKTKCPTDERQVDVPGVKFSLTATTELTDPSSSTTLDSLSSHPEGAPAKWQQEGTWEGVMSAPD